MVQPPARAGRATRGAQGYAEAPGVRRDTQGYAGIRRDTQGYAGIRRDTQGHAGARRSS